MKNKSDDSEFERIIQNLLSSLQAEEEAKRAAELMLFEELQGVLEDFCCRTDEDQIGAENE